MQVEIAENRDMCNWVQSVLVFHPPFKRTVMGSNPVAPTNNINDLATLRGGFFMSQRRLSDSQKNSSFKKNFDRPIRRQNYWQKNYDRPLLRRTVITLACVIYWLYIVTVDYINKGKVTMLKHQIIVKRDLAKVKQKHKSWYVDLSRTSIKKVGGKKGQTKFYYATKEEANAFAAQCNTGQIEGGVILRHPEKSVGAAIQKFIDRTNQREEDGIICDSHRISLLKAMFDWRTIKINDRVFADIQAVDVTPAMVEELLHSFKTKAGTRKHKHNALKYVFDVAIREGWCLKNPARMAKLEIQKYVGEYKAEKAGLEKISLPLIRQLVDLSATIGGTKGIVIAFAAQTGLRFGEQSALKWKHIDFARKVVKVRVAMRRQRGGNVSADIPKMTKQKKISKARRDVFLTPDLQKRLQEYKLQSKFSSDEDYVFPTRLGTHERTADNWRRRVLHPMCDEIDGLPRIRWHDLRHVFASMCLATFGDDMPRIADLMGHQSIETTRQQYGHWIDNPEQDASDADKFNQALWG